MQDNPNLIPVLRLPRLQRMAAASVLAFVMVAALVTNVSANATPSGRYLSMDVAQSDGNSVATDTGLVVVAIDPDSPAAEAGVARGDILQSINDVALNSTADLFTAITLAQPGDEVELFLVHGDEPRTIPVILALRGARAYLGVQVAEPPNVIIAEAVAVPVPVPGAEVAPSADNAVAVPLPMGMIVAEVMAGGPAEQAGLAAGDLILQIDGVPVATPEDLINALKGHTPGEVATLTVQKGGPVGAAIIEIPVTLGAAPDDAARAYLGIRFVATDVEMPSADGYFTAPAIPVIPPMPEYAPRYSYADPYSGYSCAYPLVQPYVYPPAYAMPYAVPVIPLMPAQPGLPAQPVAPPAPFFIYSYGVNPEVYPYTTGEKVEAETVQKDVILYRAQPAVPGGTVESFEVKKIDPWTMPIPQEGKSVTVWAQKVDDGSQAVEVYAYPAMPASPMAVPAQKQIMIWHSKDAMSGETVYAAPQGGVWVEPVPSVVQGESVAGQGVAVKGYTVQVAPESGVFEVVPVDPTTSSVIPQVEAKAVAVPAAVDDWY